ncbi:hypothetical protein EVAR_16483_1 [Eumeta japonica]|uniref:Uncharacterized protein n=1 Tax=Eumeta variegata TaxID=151549 RepID=A0A4C1UKC5_EUMVA|nr:hypothetical protein EVAR_16483_1 [Eumeta japonica]
MALLTNSAAAAGPTAAAPGAPQAHHSTTPLHHYFHYLKQPSPLAQNPYAHHSGAHHMGMGPGALGGLGPFGLTHHGLEAVGFPQGRQNLKRFFATAHYSPVIATTTVATVATSGMDDLTCYPNHEATGLM